MPEYVEVPGVLLPCGHAVKRPEPKPGAFKVSCDFGCGTYKLTAEHGGASWKAEKIT